MDVGKVYQRPLATKDYNRRIREYEEGNLHRGLHRGISSHLREGWEERFSVLQHPWSKRIGKAGEVQREGQTHLSNRRVAVYNPRLAQPLPTLARLRLLAAQSQGAIAAFPRVESKAWILPNGSIQPLGATWHAVWILKNQALVNKQFSVDLGGLKHPEDEQTIRLRALRRGFVRLRYDLRANGTLTVEMNVRFFRGLVIDAIIMFVAGNAAAIDNIVVRLLSSTGQVVRQGHAKLFTLDTRNKLRHLPLVSRHRRGQIVLRLLAIRMPELTAAVAVNNQRVEATSSVPP